MAIFTAILNWLLSGPLDRILKTIDTTIDNETTRQQIKADVIKSYLGSQVAVLTGKGWWFPLLFLIPAGLWFAAVCVYSILWCKTCIYPQSWSVAALPSPLNEWMGGIVSSLFIGKAGGDLIARLRK